MNILRKLRAVLRDPIAIYQFKQRAKNTYEETKAKSKGPRVLHESELSTRLCFFIIYRPDGLSYSLKEYIKQMKERVGYSTIILSNAKILEKDIDFFKENTAYVIERDNFGFEPAALQDGFSMLKDKISLADEVCICNDAMIGPFGDLREVHKKMDEKDCDMWGMLEAYGKCYYFVTCYSVYKKPTIPHLIEYIKNLPPIYHRRMAIKLYEVPITQYFISKGFMPEAFIKQHEVKKLIHSLDNDFLENFIAVYSEVFTKLDLKKEYEKSPKRAKMKIFSFWQRSCGIGLPLLLVNKLGFPFLKRDVIKRKLVTYADLNEFVQNLDAPNEVKRDIITGCYTQEANSKKVTPVLWKDGYV